MSFELVRQLQQKAVAVEQMCRVLEVSRSGYYAARKRSQSQAAVCKASVHLKAAFAASEGAYGSRRLRTAVASRGVVMGIYRLRRLMRQHGLRSTWRRKFVHTTDSKHWAMAPGMQAALVCRALQQAIVQRQPAAGLIVHSDRGSQYASAANQALLAKHGLVGSMSRKGNCWDNAVMERFFLNLKMERVWQRDYANHAEATSDIANYIVSFYNSVRLHSKLGNLPPNTFEQQSAFKLPIGSCEIT
ncbi:transposase [Polaromonas eurypsychrophila]|uniref:Transposase n=1 Tax=Polaromonas eurypsychrophila TaxID=1614635 RepID=A0A916SP69_9BURK|nr:transposase [Polaromonas eurypsychrophila]